MLQKPPSSKEADKAPGLERDSLSTAALLEFVERQMHRERQHVFVCYAILSMVILFLLVGRNDRQCCGGGGPPVDAARPATQATPATQAGREGGNKRKKEKKPLSLARPAPFTRAVKHGGESDDDKRRIASNCSFGEPKYEGPSPVTTICRDGYVLAHSSVDKIPVWVCEHITKEMAEGDAERKNVFKADPLLAPGARSELTDYKGYGFDMGHMAPANDQGKVQELKNETFYLSNMSPQIPQLNRTPWRALEAKVLQWAKGHAGGAYVITGPLFYDPKEDDPAKADGVINYSVIGSNKVAVPTHFYKIVLGKEAAGTAGPAIAFVLPNEVPGAKVDLAQTVKPIQWIEDRTQVHFLPDLEKKNSTEAQRFKSKATDFATFFGPN